MRDRYGRITPDFDAWEKLGWICTDIHARTFTLSRKDEPDYWDYEEIDCEYDTKITDTGKPEYIKQRISIANSRLLDFTPEEKAQIEKDIKNWEEEMAAELDYQRSIEQVEHDELYEPTYDPDNGSM